MCAWSCAPDIRLSSSTGSTAGGSPAAGMSDKDAGTVETAGGGALGAGAGGAVGGCFTAPTCAA